ncbi:hypothetical protein V8E54_014503 [Elaphomyces granulatus]
MMPHKKVTLAKVTAKNDPPSQPDRCQRNVLHPVSPSQIAASARVISPPMPVADRHEIETAAHKNHEPANIPEYQLTRGRPASRSVDLKRAWRGSPKDAKRRNPISTPGLSNAGALRLRCHSGPCRCSSALRRSPVPLSSAFRRSPFTLHLCCSLSPLSASSPSVETPMRRPGPRRPSEHGIELEIPPFNPGDLLPAHVKSKNTRCNAVPRGPMKKRALSGFTRRQIRSNLSIPRFSILI